MEQAPEIARGLPAWLERLRKYGLALLFVGVAVILRWVSPDALSPAPTLVFYLAWVGAAAFGGLGPGLLATVASWLCIELLFDPTPGRIGFGDAASTGRLLILLGGGFVVSMVGDTMRRARFHERRQAAQLAGLARSLAGEREILRESEEKYRSIVETATEAMVIVDAQAGIIFVNDRWLEMFGYSQEEALDMTLFDLVFPEDLVAMKQRWESRKVGRRETYEFRVRRKDGNPIWVLVGVTPNIGPEGEFLGTLSMLADITERKRAEDALRESAERLRLALDASHAGTWEWDLGTDKNVWSEEIWRLYGLQPHVCEPSYEAWRAVIHPDDRAAAERTVLKAARDGAEMNFEYRVLDAGGDTRWLMWRGRPVLDSGRKPVRYIGIVLDITERKHAEDALRELNATLETKVARRTQELEHRASQLQKLTQELTEAEERERKRLAGVLHDDLQQLLAAAKFHLEVLSKRVESDGESRESAHATLGLLVDAIAKSRSLSHELSPPPLSRGDLSGAFEWLAGQMETKHGFTVHLEITDRIEVASEPRRFLLYKAAQELLLNVIKHAGVREATVRLRHRGGRILLTVADRGRGFDAADPAHAPGLGLMSIRERVEGLGGRLKIKSAPGKGSAFVVAVPDAEG